MAATSHLCERARGWASLRADGELSELESALLDAHLGRCLPCRSFAGGAEEVAAALRAARLERPAPLALVLPRRNRRSALRALEVTVATALVVAAGAIAALVGVRPGAAPTAAKRVAVVAMNDSPDTLRELRRPLLVSPIRPVPRNRRLPDESA
jgi:predicted anti-sigma-YlaC factor YlaD